MADVLIVEDDVAFSQLLERFLGKHGFLVSVAHDIKTGTDLLQKSSYDIVLLDYRLPDGLGMDILTLLRNEHPDTAPIIMTSFHDVRTAVTTIRSGAYDYITKPVNPDELLLVVREVLNKKQISEGGALTLRSLEGTSKESRQLQEHIQLVAPTDFSVIIRGESGTGKELAARSIHHLSKRKSFPFVALDCGALSADLASSELFGHVAGAFTGAVQNKSGVFEEANGGTLFLDEVGNLSYEIQVKLLRALQEREIQPVGSNRQIKVNVRIITATNDNLLYSVKAGKFREDLYHRLNEFTIQVPSLQERREDIPLFIQHFISLTNADLEKHVKKASAEVLSLFLKYDWPGNLRELKNIVKRAVLLTEGEEITTAVIPQEMMHAVLRESGLNADLKVNQAINERELIVKTLEQVKYNKSKAARLLNIDRTTLYYKIAKYHID